MLYKLPQAAYPYELLIEENARRRGSAAMEFELIDTGIFDGDKYFDIEIEYAKADGDDVGAYGWQGEAFSSVPRAALIFDRNRVNAIDPAHDA
jgi:hypothetical protein